MQEFSIEALLSLYSVAGIGGTKMRKLISFFGSPQAVLDASSRQLMELEGIDKKTAQNIKSGINHHFVELQLKMLEKGPAKILTFWDKQYPERLKRIYDPPAFLFVEGNLELIDMPSIGIVGSRLPTDYGKTITEIITRDLVKKQITIISGFARGIDSVAHKTTLAHGGNTIAVLGNGLDIVYPSENIRLKKGFEKQGLFISEYPFFTKPDAGNFPKRNRIISGLSLGVLVTEAGEKSGALLTAMYALDQNREVFAVPGPVNSEASRGTNNLIKQGARLVQSADDIIAEISAYLDVDVNKPKPAPNLKGLAKVIYNLLENEPLHIDQLARKAEVSTSEALTCLLTLELSGNVRQMAGKMFTRL